MELQNSDTFSTKYANFSLIHLEKHPSLMKTLERSSQCPELYKILWEDENWQVDDDPLGIEYEAFLHCMTHNYALTIDFLYIPDYNLITTITFHRLQQLHFSVYEGSSGYLRNIEFIGLLNAPNLRVLDISNIQDGCFRMRPLRKAFFPQLQELNILGYLQSDRSFYDINILSQGHFPQLSAVLLDQWTIGYVDGQKWMAKFESRCMKKVLEKSIKEKNMQEVEQIRKKVKI